MRDRNVASVMRMGSHNFLIFATIADSEAIGIADRLFEAGCDDGTVSFQNGMIVIEFDRDARTLDEALQSAIDDVTSAGAQVIRYEIGE